RRCGRPPVGAPGPRPKVLLRRRRRRPGGAGRPEVPAPRPGRVPARREGDEPDPSRRDRRPGERHADLRRRRPALAPDSPDAREAAWSPAALSLRALEDRPLSRYATHDDPLRGTPRVLADGGARAAARAARAGRCAGARLRPVSPGMSDARAPPGVSPHQGATVSS